MIGGSRVIGPRDVECKLGRGGGRTSLRRPRRGRRRAYPARARRGPFDSAKNLTPTALGSAQRRTSIGLPTSIDHVLACTRSWSPATGHRGRARSSTRPGRPWNQRTRSWRSQLPFGAKKVRDRDGTSALLGGTDTTRLPVAPRFGALTSADPQRPGECTSACGWRHSRQHSSRVGLVDTPIWHQTATAISYMRGGAGSVGRCRSGACSGPVDRHLRSPFTS